MTRGNERFLFKNIAELHRFCLLNAVSNGSKAGDFLLENLNDWKGEKGTEVMASKRIPRLDEGKFELDLPDNLKEVFLNTLILRPAMMRVVDVAEKEMQLNEGFSSILSLIHAANLVETHLNELIFKKNCTLSVSMAMNSSIIGKCEADELINIAHSGLYKAIWTFDHTKGFKFSTHACHWIMQAIKYHEYSNQQATPLRIPVHLYMRYSQINRIKTDLIESNKSPSLEKVWEILLQEDAEKGIFYKDKKKYELKLEEARNLYSLGDGISIDQGFQSDSESKSCESIECLSENLQTEDIYNKVEEDERKKLIHNILNNVLTPEEALVIKMNMGIGTGIEVSKRDIATTLNMSPSKVSYLLKEGLKKLRFELVGIDPTLRKQKQKNGDVGMKSDLESTYDSDNEDVVVENPQYINANLHIEKQASFDFA